MGTSIAHDVHAPRVARPQPRVSGGGIALIVGAVLLTVLVVVGPVSAYQDGYRAVGDDALIASYTRDVFTSETPLVGMPASTGRYSGVQSSHPGPLLFWLYAPWVLLFGDSTGLLVGAALVNLGAALACGWAARRRGGDWVGLLGLAAAAAALAVVGGPAGSFRPINSLIVSLPFLLFLILSWGVAERDRVVVPIWALVGSLLVQSDLIFVAQVLGLAFAAAIVAARSARREPSPPPEPQTDRAAAFGWTLAGVWILLLVAMGVASWGWWAAVFAIAALCAVGAIGRVWITGDEVADLVESRTSRVTLGVVLVAWMLPISEVIANGGGNVAKLAAYAAERVPSQGLHSAMGAAQQALAPPAGPITEGGFERGIGIVGVALVVGLGILAWKGTPVVRRLLVIVAAAVATGAFAASQAPAESGFSFQHLSWVPVIAAFVWFAVAVGVGSAFGAPDASLLGRTVTAGVVLVACVAWPLRNPSTAGLSGPERWAHQAVAALVPEVRAAITEGTYAIVAAGNPSMDGEAGAIRAALDRGPTEILVLESASLVGDRSVFHPGDAPLDGIIAVVPAGGAGPEGTELIATWSPPNLDEAEVADLAGEVSAFARTAPSLTLRSDVTGSTDRLLAPWVEGTCLKDLFPRGDCTAPPVSDLLEPGAERALLEAYASGWVTAPQLPSALRERVDRVDQARGVSVWLGAPPPSLR